MRVVFAAFTLGAAWAHAPVLAADLSPPSWSWSGCYGGVHAGGIWGEADDWTPVTPGGAFIGQSLGGHSVDGIAGGVQLGCDYAFANNVVVGLQGSYTWSDAEGSHPSTRETGVSYHSKTHGLGTATARVGYAFDRLLGYVKGGIAWQQDEYWATTTTLGEAYNARQTRTGVVAGVGAEYAVTNTVSAFVGYDYAYFGTGTVPLTPQVPGLNPASVDITSDTSIIRAGINLRFGGPFRAGR